MRPPDGPRAVATGVVFLTLLLLGGAGAAPGGPVSRAGSLPVGHTVPTGTTAAPRPSLSKIDLDVARSPYLPAYDPLDQEFYVPGSGTNEVSVINGTTVVANLTVGLSPMFAVYDGADGEVYVSNSGASSVSVLAGTTVVANVSVGRDPGEAAYDPADGLVYVPNAGTGNVSVIHGTSVVATLRAGPTDAVAVFDPAQSYVDVLNTAAGNVTVLSGTSLVGTVTVGADPSAALYDSADGYLFVANGGASSISVLSGRSVVGTLSVGSQPQAMAFDNFSGRIFVPDLGSSEVTVLHGTTVLGKIGVGASPGFAAYDPVDGAVYIANQQSNTVTIVNGSTDGTLATIPVGDFPQAIAVDDLTGAVAVTNYDTDNVSLFLVPSFPVTVVASGLPGGTPWSVMIGRRGLGSTTGEVVADLANGTYAFSLGAVTDFTGSPASGVFTVTGAPVRIPVAFTEQYAVTFDAGGLPSGTNWSVTLGHTLATTNGSTITFDRPNGTYAYAANATGFSPIPATGNITVDGTPPAVVALAFSVTRPPAYPVAFTVGGLPTGAAWTVTLNATSTTSTNATIGFAEPNGSYAYRVSAPRGLAATPAEGIVEVEGSAVGVAIALFARPTGEFAITFLASGLPAGTPWSVSLGGSPGNSSVAVIAFTEVNGTYTFTVGALAGLAATPSTGSVPVNGSAVTVTVAFRSTAGPPPPPTGLAALTAPDLLGLEAVVLAGVVAVLAIRRRRRAA